MKWHGTAGGPGGRDRTLAVKSRKKRLKKGEKQWPSYAWRMQVAWAKILGETNFQTREFPRSGSKTKDGGEKRGEKERLNYGKNNGQATHGACKHAWRT